MKTVINGKLNPELGKIIDRSLDLSCSDIIELPEGLKIKVEILYKLLRNFFSFSTF